MRTHIFRSLPTFFLFIGCTSASKPTSPAMVVKVAVADVRSNESRHNKKYEYDPAQETQILKGERVLVREKKGEWALIECPEQWEYTHNLKWEGYPGWTLLSNLTDAVTNQFRPEPVALNENELRSEILRQARRHLGSPYLWGGRSLYDSSNKETITGVDCSGLVNWSFRQAGHLVPRDSHELFMKAVQLKTADLKPADLLFLANKTDPKKIVHVAFISGEETLLEAPQSGEKVREITFKSRFGKSLKELSNGDTIGDRVIYFGTLFQGGL